MTERTPKLTEKGTKTVRPGEKAFDAWLNQGLHKLFDEISREPLPDELLKLIEDHREK